MRVKKITAITLAMCMLILTVPVRIVAQNDKTPYAQVFYDGTDNVNIEKSSFIEPSNPIYEMRDGVKVLKLRDGGPTYAAIDVKNGLFSANVDTSLAVTVRYFDEIAGKAIIRYSSETGKNLESSLMETEGSGTWKEHTFYLDKCVFNNGEGGYDFLFARWSAKKGGFSTPMYVQWIKIEESLPHNPFNVTVTSDYVGNIFAGDENKVLYVNAENWTDMAIDATLHYAVRDSDKNLLDKGTVDGCHFEPGEKLVVNVSPNVSRYSTYSLEVSWELRREHNGQVVNSTSDTVDYDFSIGNKIKRNEPTNQTIWTNLKVGCEAWYDTVTAAKLVRELGIAGVRDSFYWNGVEKEKGVYTVPVGREDWITLSYDNGIEVMYDFIGNGGNALYGLAKLDPTVRGNVIMPDDDVFPGSVDAYCNYVDWISKTYKGKIKYYELWNEPNLTGFNVNNTTPEKYAELLKRVYEIIKKNDPEGQVIAFSTAQPALSWVRKALEAGAIDYMDGASTHPYDWDGKFDVPTYRAKVQSFIDLFAEFGRPDMPIHLTEIGIRDHVEGGWGNANVAAAQNIEYYAVTQAENLGTVYQFSAINNYPNILWENGSGEQRWGLLNHGNERVPFSARPAAISTMAYNKLIGNAEMVNCYTDDQNLTYVYHFKRDLDGKDVIIYWTEYGSETFGLKLGTGQAELYDMYSNNEGTIYATDGVITVTSSFEPAYIIGSFPEFEKVAPKINTNGGRFSAIHKDDVAIEYSDAAKRNLRIGVDKEDNLTLTEIKDVVNGAGKIVITTGEKFVNEEHAVVKLYDGDKMVYYGKYHILEAEKPVTFSATCKRENDKSNRFVLSLTVENLTQGLTMTGSIEADFTGLGSKKQSRNIYNLKPGMSATLNYWMPDTHAKGPMEIPVSYKFDNDRIGDDVVTLEVIPDYTCAYAETAPNIIGDYNIKEWRGSDWFKAGDAFTARSYAGWTGLRDASFEGTALWDEENLYLLLEAKDDRFYVTSAFEGGMSWQGDGFQFGIKNETSAGMFGTDFTEISIYRSVDGKSKIYRFTSQFTEMGAMDYIECDVNIEKINGKWIYRAAIPWTSLVGTDTPNEGDIIRMGALYNDNDGEGRQYIEFAEGIAREKTPAGFSRLILKK